MARARAQTTNEIPTLVTPTTPPPLFSPHARLSVSAVHCGWGVHNLGKTLASNDLLLLYRLATRRNLGH